uniref:Laminin G domain-containing protein n=1 Tax=Musca domestica TaxID=7370 RepID=A0A1I8MA36_MUSDO
MFSEHKQRMSNQKHQQSPKSLKNVLTCLLVTILLLFVGHGIGATPITRLRRQQQSGSYHQHHQNHNLPQQLLQQQQQQPFEHEQHHHHRQQQQQQQQQKFQETSTPDCEHKSLVELIKTSPIILKALGSHIFSPASNINDGDDNNNNIYDEDLHVGLGDDDVLLSSWQSEQIKFARYKATSSSSSPSSSSGSSVYPASQLHPNSRLLEEHRQKASELNSLDMMTAKSDAILSYSSSNSDALLITLTPDTIYKGASLLKTATNAAVTPANTRNAGSSAFGSSAGGFNSADTADAANDGDTLYSSSESAVEGQLNATIEPLSCFDENLLKMLPTDLIIFGELITMDQQQQQPNHQHQQQSHQQPFDLLNAPRHSYSMETSLPSSSSSVHHQSQQQRQKQHQPSQQTKQILRVSINGLHRWSAQFESFIWTHLGWDDWSDFTVCSVACGKGVQQRFRRCLLDNPMVDMKMNFNEIEEEEIQAEEEELEVEEQVEQYDDDNELSDDDSLGDAEEEKQYDDIDRMIFEDDDDDEIIEQLKAIDNYDSADDGVRSNDVGVGAGAGAGAGQAVAFGFINERYEKPDVRNKKHRRRAQLSQDVGGENDGEQEDGIEVPSQTDVYEVDNNMLHFVTAPSVTLVGEKTQSRKAKNNRKTRTTTIATATTTTTEQPEIMRIFEGDFNDVYSERIYNESPFNGPQLSEDKRDLKMHKKGQRSKHRRHKSAKIVSTMFCEGYNIEQRTCNNFECSDDINDLLKFYRKYPSGSEETSAASTQSLNNDFNTAPSASVASSLLSSSSATAAVWPVTSSVTTSAAAAASSYAAAAPSTQINDLGLWSSFTENTNTITPVPRNTGFVKTWHNFLNFTIMLTLRAKNDSYNSATTTTAATTATIFSIRNGTHNLYLETYRDGLHLYLERDKTTEMLPIQFNLYDYRWHQVAISIKNGDFITIYIDCSWSNSFVVSKRLFSLPLDADVEVGRGFNGELQQLLILPRLQGRRQCSDKRISINEVKRYIIDTFIGDYGN